MAGGAQPTVGGQFGDALGTILCVLLGDLGGILGKFLVRSWVYFWDDLGGALGGFWCYVWCDFGGTLDVLFGVLVGWFWRYVLFPWAI